MPSCSTCTRRLVELAYTKSFWFRFFREPLKFGMRLMVKLKGIDITVYKINNEYCTNCNRFYKNALKEKSPLFLWLNNKINPVFDRWLEKIVTEEEIKKAKNHATAIKDNTEIPDGWNKQKNLKKWNKI
jgi:hypothetical protein